jgi:hypothetical protein
MANQVKVLLDFFGFLDKVNSHISTMRGVKYKYINLCYFVFYYSISMLIRKAMFWPCHVKDNSIYY